MKYKLPLITFTISLLGSNSSYSHPLNQETTVIGIPYAGEENNSVLLSKLSGNGKKNSIVYVVQGDHTLTHIYKNSNSAIVQPFITPAGNQSFISDVSYSGNIIVGTALENNRVHAYAWSGENYDIMTPLGGSRNQLGSSIAKSISKDENYIGGTIELSGNPEPTAVIWSGENWNEENFLPGSAFEGEALNPYSVNVLSGNGSVAAGSSRDINSTDYATIWSGEKWKNPQVLDGKGSNVYALSEDGSIAAGMSSQQQAKIWHGSQWSTATILPALAGSSKNISQVLALSENGFVAAGASLASSNFFHAVLWSGNNWGEITDLNDSVSGSKASIIQSLSSDASVASGYSTDAQGNTHAMLWKIKWPEVSKSEDEKKDTVKPPSSNAAPSDKDEVNVEAPDKKNDDNVKEKINGSTKKPVIVAVDKKNTTEAVAKVSGDIISIMQLQLYSLRRLEEGCYPSEGKTCWSVRTGYNKGSGTSDTYTGFSFGKSISPSFSFGANLDKSLSRKLPDSFRNTSGNIGGSVYFRLEKEDASGKWFLMPSLAYNHYRSEAYRPELENTEAAKGRTSLKGYGFSITAGKSYVYSNKTEVELYTGFRKNSVRMNGWTEKNIEFPLSWSSADYTRKEIFAGIETSIPLNDSLIWNPSFEISQRIGKSGLNVNANNSMLGSYKYQWEGPRTLWTASSKLSYKLSNDTSIFVTPSVWRSMNDKNTYSVSAGISSSF